MTDLTSRETHFAFGENWREFGQLIDAQHIARSDESLAKLLASAELSGKSAIDIGCGSGLPALSMLRAGARHVTCVDIDPVSVATAQKTLGTGAAPGQWSASVSSVFDLTGAYDVVYSWGVLHHTGDMWRAIDKAASLVKPGGLLAIAIYCKTPLCGFWRVEKRLYSKAPRALQLAALLLFTAWRIVVNIAVRQPALGFMKGVKERGMDWWRDQHDWLGGYPYESATPAEIRTFLSDRGFSLVRENLVPGGRPGVLGSGCDEYVFRATEV